MDRNYYHQRIRGQIRPLPRLANKKLPVERKDYTTPAVVKENLTKYSTVTPVFVSSIPTPKPSIRHHKFSAKSKIKTRNLKKNLADTTNKSMLLSKAIQANARREKRHQTNKLIARRLSLGIFLMILLGSTGYVSINVWQTNTQAEQVLATSKPSTPKKIDKSTSTQTLAKGIDITKPSASSLTSYKVAPDFPRSIYIKNISVSARVMPMGVNSDRSMQSPSNAFDAGWYTASAKPGQAGAMLVDGHASQTGTHYGLFGYITKLKNGDQITIERGDGVRFNYVVAHTEVTPLANVDMNKLLVPYGGAKQGINLIACTGKWTSDKSTLDQRVLVFATLKG